MWSRRLTGALSTQMEQWYGNSSHGIPHHGVWLSMNNSYMALLWMHMQLDVQCRSMGLSRMSTAYSNRPVCLLCTKLMRYDSCLRSYHIMWYFYRCAGDNTLYEDIVVCLLCATLMRQLEITTADLITERQTNVKHHIWRENSCYLWDWWCMIILLHQF